MSLSLTSGMVGLVLLGVGCVSSPSSTDQSSVKETYSPTFAQSSQAKLALKSELVGSWKVIKAQTSFSSLTIHADGKVTTFLDGQPLMEGSWQYQKGVLTLILGNDETVKDVYSQVKIVGDRLSAKLGPISIVWQRVQ